MSEFPHRGTRRDDVRAGLRITHYRRRAAIAFSVDESALRVTILGVYYGGRDYEGAVRQGDEFQGLCADKFLHVLKCVLCSWLAMPVP